MIRARLGCHRRGLDPYAYLRQVLTGCLSPPIGRSKAFRPKPGDGKLSLPDTLPEPNASDYAGNKKWETTDFLQWLTLGQMPYASMKLQSFCTRSCMEKGL